MKGFQTLIGTVKGEDPAWPVVRASAFQTLIGTVKGDTLGHRWARYLEFQTLIGTVKGCGECFFAEHDFCLFQTLIGTVKGGRHQAPMSREKTGFKPS